MDLYLYGGSATTMYNYQLRYLQLADIDMCGRYSFWTCPSLMKSNKDFRITAVVSICLYGLYI